MANGAILGQTTNTYNKEQIMASTVPPLFGLGSDAVPSDVLEFLGKYNQHWWKKSHSRLKTRNVGTKNVIDFRGVPGNDVYATIKYSRRAEIVNGEIQLSGSIQSVNVGYRSINSGSVISSILKGRYFYISYIYSSATSDFTTGKVYRTDGDLAIGEAYEVTLTSVYDVYIDSISDGFVQSSDRSAYPDSGEQDGYGYQYLGIPFENAVTAPKIAIATGSYTGTGTYGNGDPNSLTFEFKPKFIIVQCSATSNITDTMLLPCVFLSDSRYLTGGITYISSDNSNLSMYGVVAKSSNNGKTVMWYSGENYAYHQMNQQGETYYYVAFG